jgi:hypothetical protein
MPETCSNLSSNLPLLWSGHTTCMKRTIVKCTADNSWWWAQKMPETCRVSWQNKFWIFDSSSWLFYTKDTFMYLTVLNYYSPARKPACGYVPSPLQAHMSYTTHPHTRAHTHARTIFLPYTSVCRRWVLIFFLLRLFTPHSLFTSGSLINWFHVLLLSPLHATCQVHPTASDFSRVILLCSERQKLSTVTLQESKIFFMSLVLPLFYTNTKLVKQNTGSEIWYTQH